MESLQWRRRPKIADFCPLSWSELVLNNAATIVQDSGLLNSLLPLPYPIDARQRHWQPIACFSAREIRSDGRSKHAGGFEWRRAMLPENGAKTGVFFQYVSNLGLAEVRSGFPFLVKAPDLPVGASARAHAPACRTLCPCNVLHSTTSSPVFKGTFWPN